MSIQVESLSYSYPSGIQALKNVSLTIQKGEILAIIGENGAGKSTLVKHFNGLLRPSSGKITIDDVDISQTSTAKLAKTVGFLFQNPDEQLFERSIFREVAFGPKNFDLDTEQIENRVNQALKSVGLEKEKDSHPYDLPYTKRKLIALAATLALVTPILLLDEPTVGQDSIQQQAIGELLSKLHREGRTIIIISHNLDFCASIVHRIIVMSAGTILADGPADEVLTKSSILNQAAVNAPQIVRLAQALEMPNAPLKIPHFVEEYAQWKKEKNDSNTG